MVPYSRYLLKNYVIRNDTQTLGFSDVDTVDALGKMQTMVKNKYSVSDPDPPGSGII